MLDTLMTGSMWLRRCRIHACWRQNGEMIFWSQSWILVHFSTLNSLARQPIYLSYGTAYALAIYRRGRGRPQIVFLQGSASSTETAMKWDYSSWCNHLRSTRLHVFGPFQLYGFYHWYRGPTQLKRTPVGNELWIDKPFLEFEGT